MDPHDTDAIRSATAALDGWEFVDDRIRRRLRFPGFRDAIDFIVRVADLAEAAEHHPELTNVYADVTIELTSHDVGGVTDRDISLAREIDRVVGPGETVPADHPAG